MRSWRTTPPPPLPPLPLLRVDCLSQQLDFRDRKNWFVTGIRNKRDPTPLKQEFYTIFLLTFILDIFCKNLLLYPL